MMFEVVLELPVQITSGRTEKITGFETSSAKNGCIERI